MKKDKIKKFLEKHPPLSDEEIKKRFREADLAKDKYTKNMQELERNLLGFREILDPIIDPETGKCLAWMKRPTNLQLEKFFMWYEDRDITKLPRKEQLAIADRQYKMMEELIVPKHDAKWWKENTNPLFSKLFANRLELFFEQMGVIMENF